MQRIEEKDLWWEARALGSNRKSPALGEETEEENGMTARQLKTQRFYPASVPTNCCIALKRLLFKLSCILLEAEHQR